MECGSLGEAGAEAGCGDRRAGQGRTAGDGARRGETGSPMVGEDVEAAPRERVGAGLVFTFSREMRGSETVSEDIEEAQEVPMNPARVGEDTWEGCALPPP